MGELKQQLRAKYEIIHREYQNYTHITKIDTLILKRKKEECECNLQSIQKYLQLLSNPYIFVDSLC